MTQSSLNPDELPEETGDSSAGSDDGQTPGADASAPGPDPEEAQADQALDAAVAELARANEDLARARADYYNLNQEYSNYVRRTKTEASAQRRAGQQEVVEALLGLLDDIDAAREAGELADGPFASMAEKLEDTLSGKFSLERFGAAGEDFDPEHHEALMAQSSPDVDHPVIQLVLQPGYKMGDRVLRATKVVVDNPE